MENVSGFLTSRGSLSQNKPSQQVTYLVKYAMLRWFFAIFFIINFASYVFAHGSCAYSESDVAKCESIKSQHRICEQSDTSTKSPSSQNTDEVFHICGCVGLFLQKDLVQSLEFYPSVVFATFHKVIINNEFYRRIERPPIKLT